jgi:hypothetical protein
MNRLFLTAALAAGCTLASSSSALAAARNYDCSKAGNANKAACKTGAKDAAKMTTKPAPAAKTAAAKPAPKTAAAKPAPASAPVAKPSMFQRMSNALTGSKPAPAAKPAPKRVAAAASNEDRNPAGAIAQCKDGTYSHAKARTGACSRHGGVAKWS